MNVERLRDEEHRHRQVDAGPIQVEAVTGRDHHPHHVAPAPHHLQLFHHPRQRALARAGPQHQQDFLADAHQVAPQRKAERPADQRQHHEDEQSHRQVDAPH